MQARPRERFRTLTYYCAWNSARWVLRDLLRGDIYGAEQVPRTGPFILASNHASFLDPPIVGAAVPREICYFARKTLFKGAFGKLITDLNSIPVDRDGSDVSAIKKVLAKLKQGEGIIMFPEGTRTSDGNLQPARSGVGMIACKTGVPVVPVRVYGTYEVYSRHMKLPDLRHPLTVVFGKPLTPEHYDPGKGNKERYLEASNRIMGAIEALKNPHGR